jgi:hypothetical protein
MGRIFRRSGPALAVAVTALLLTGLPAAAQIGRDPAVRAACRGDVQRLCAGVQPGGGRMAQCMKAHVREISPQCIDAVKTARAARRGGRSAATPMPYPPPAPSQYPAPPQYPAAPSQYPPPPR